MSQEETPRPLVAQFWRRKDLDLPGTPDQVIAWANAAPGSSGRYIVRILRVLDDRGLVWVRQGTANHEWTLDDLLRDWRPM